MSSDGYWHDTYVKKLETLFFWTRIAAVLLPGAHKEGTGGFYSMILKKTKGM